MKTIFLRKNCGWLLLIFLLFSAANANGQTTGFLYQGKLDDPKMTAAIYDFEFRLCASATDCTAPLAVDSQSGVDVNDGNFTVKINFVSAELFDGADKFLEIAYKHPSETTFITIAPRRKITAEDLTGNSNRAANLGGTGNLFIGTNAGASNTSGSFNVFVGNETGGSNTSGFWNSFFGAAAGTSTTTGSGNTFFGNNAGGNNNIGNYNTAVGYLAGSNGSYINSTAIGANSLVAADNSLILGSINGINGATADTRVGIGTTAPIFKLQVVDPSNTGLRVQTNITGGRVASFGGNGAFQVDAVNVPGGRFTILENGNVGIGVANPLAKLEIGGNIDIRFQVKFGQLGSGGSTQLCRNSSNVISTCSSSLRYKTDIQPFTDGMTIVKRLSPIAYKWKDGGALDVGFGAEDVAGIEPRLVTYNQSGQVEGLKYDRLSTVFVNAFKEQQTQIEAQAEQIKQQQQQIDELKKIVCGLKSEAAICQP